MARKRNESLWLMLPWWVNAIAGMVFYLAVKFVLPTITTSNIVLQPLLKAAPLLAPIVALFFSVATLMTAFKQYERRRLLESQTGLESIRALDWRQFEFLLSEAFRRQGYFVVENQSAGADGGVDLWLRMDGELVLVQCKQWRSYKVPVNVVRELFGLVKHHGASRGILVTSGKLTNDASDFARASGIEAIEGEKLVKLIRDVQTIKRASVESEPTPTADFTATKTSAVSPNCPRCQSPMTLRTARQGSNQGNQFWGCTNYPKCRGIRSLS